MRDLPTLDRPDEDPYLWLEEVSGEKAVAWVDERSAKTRAAFAGPGFEADRAALLAIMDSPDKLPHITRRGDRLYNFWIDADNPKGVWRRTTLAAFRAGKPDWDIVIDVDALARDEGEDWIWAGARTLAGSHDRALVLLSVGGGDATVMREFDMEALAFVEGGFALPEAKTDVDWYDRDTLLVGSALGEGMATARAMRARRGSGGGAPISPMRRWCSTCRRTISPAVSAP